MDLLACLTWRMFYKMIALIRICASNVQVSHFTLIIVESVG